MPLAPNFVVRSLRVLVLVALVGCGARSALWLGTPAVAQPEAGAPVEAALLPDAPGGADSGPPEAGEDSAPPVDAGCVPAPDGGIVLPIQVPGAIPVAVGLTPDRLYIGTSTSGLNAIYDGGVFDVPLSGLGGTPSVVSAPDYNYGQLVTDDAYVYYLQTVGRSVGPNSSEYMTTGIGAIVGASTPSSTTPLVVAPYSTSSLSNAWMIAADPSVSGVFWAGGSGGGPGATEILRWTVNGGATEVATGQSIDGIEVRGGYLYWAEAGAGPGITIFRALPTGGTKATVATVSEGTYGYLLGVSKDEVVFVSDYLSAAIYVAPATGGAPRLLLNATPPWTNDAAWVDDAYLYWVEEDTTTVLRRIALTGGSAETVPTMGSVGSVAFDACNLYVGSTEPTQVLVIPKPGT